MELLKLSVEYNGCTYWIVGDSLNADEMRDALIDEVLSENGYPDELGYFVEASDIEPLITSETFELGYVYREC